MAKKTVTIRLSEEAYEYVASSNSDSINKAIEDSILALKSIREKSMAELKGVFTKDEWAFLADSLNGTLVVGAFRSNVGALVAHCEDADSIDGLGRKWVVSIDELTGKILTLRGANIDAIYKRVEDFLNSDVSIEEWGTL